MADNSTKIVISADTSAATTSIKNFSATLEGLSGKVAGLSTMAGHVGSAFAILATGGAAAGGLGAVVKGAIDAADKLNDLSQQVGISVKALAGYELAANQSGTSLEAIGRGVKGLSQNLLENGKALSAAGITAKDADGAMRQIADLFSQMPDGIEKTTLATKLFGKSGMEMIPMLNMGSKGLNDAAEKSEKYAAAMAALAPQADAFNDSLGELSMSGKILGLTLANDMMPFLLQTSSAMALAAQQGGIMEAALVGLGGALSPLSVLYKGFMNTLDEANLKLLEFFNAGEKDGSRKKLAADIARRNQEILTLIPAAAKAVEKQEIGPPKINTEAWRKQAEELKKALKIGDDGVASIKKTGDEYGNLIKSLNERLAVSKLESSSIEKLTTGEKEYAKFLAGSKFANDAVARALYERIIAEEKAAAGAEEWAKIKKEWNDGLRKEADERLRAIEALEDQAIKAEAELETYGLTKSMIEAVTISRLEEQRVMAAKNGASEETIANLEREIAARRRIRDALQGVEGRDAAKKAAEESAKEWEKFSSQIEQSITDALMRGFEAGDGFGKSFVKSLQNTLKTTVLKMAVQAVVSPVSSGIGQMLGMPGAGGGAVGDILSTGSSLANLDGVGGSLGGFSAGYASMAAEMAAGSSFVGPSVAAANGALGAGAATASALGPIATAAPYIAAALVIANATGMFGKRGGPQQGEYGQFGAGGYQANTTMSGGDALGNKALNESAYNQAAALYAMAGKKIADITIQQGYKLDPQGTSQGLAYRNILVGGKMITPQNLAMFGNSDSASAAALLGKLNTAEIVALVKEIADPKLSAAAEALLANFGELEKSLPAWSIAQASQQALTQSLMTDAEKLDATSETLHRQFAAMGMSMPTSTSGLKSLVDGLDLTTQSGQDTLASLKDLVPAFVAFDQQTQATRDALEQQMDGVAKAIEAMGMTALEKSLSDISAATRAAIEQAAKLSATEEQLAKVRELGAKQAAALLGSEASKAYTGLLTASGKQIEAMQFQLAEAQAAYSTAVSALADDNKISIDQVNEYIQKAGSLDAAAKQYWGELGDAQDAQTQRKKQLLIEMVNAATAVDTLDKQLADARVAAQKESNDAQLAAQKEASDQLSALMAQRLEWQTQLDILQEKTTQQQIERDKQLASTADAATQSIMRQVFALQDQKAAAAAASAAIEAAAERARAIAAKQRDLDIQLLEVRGQSAAATAARRADVLSALENEQLRATQQQIWMAQDATVAQEAAAKAAEEQRRVQQELVDGWKRTAESIIGTVKSLTGSMFDETQGFAKAQADFAIATAAAKAGDQVAANSLPDLAKALVDLGKVNSVTAIDQALLTARTAGALRDVVGGIGNRFGIEVPAFAAGGKFGGGLRMVGEFGPELEVTGASHIYSAGQSRDIMGDLIGEMRNLRAENAALREIIDRRLALIELHTLDTSKGVHGENRAPILTELA